MWTILTLVILSNIMKLRGKRPVMVGIDNTLCLNHWLRYGGLVVALAPPPGRILMKRIFPYSPLIKCCSARSTYSRNRYHKKMFLHTTVPIPLHPNLLCTPHWKPLHIHLEILQTLVVRFIPLSILYFFANGRSNVTPPPSLIVITDHRLHAKIYYEDDCNNMPWTCTLGTRDEHLFMPRR